MDDYKSYRAPRWHDGIAAHAPELIAALLILALTLDHYGVWK